MAFENSQKYSGRFVPMHAVDTFRRISDLKNLWFFFVFACVAAGLWGQAGALAQPGGSIAKAVANGAANPIPEFDDRGRLARLQLDTNKDGRMDTFQYYDGEQVVRIERDENGDGRIDRIDYLEEGKRFRQVRLRPQGKIFQEITFDGHDRIARMREDTTRDGVMDTVLSFEKGTLTSLTRDKTGDGRINEWEYFREGKPYQRREDLDGDGSIEHVVFFDAKGTPLRSETDTDKDGFMDLYQTFRNGVLESQKKDGDHDGKFESVVRYEAGMIKRAETDADGDGYRETVVTYSGNHAAVQEIRSQSTGKPVSRTFFNPEGGIAKVETDLSLDGRMDFFQRYEQGNPVEAKYDENDDGVIDAVAWYVNGQKTKLIRDHDHDGRFEITQWFDRPPWQYVLEVDADGNGQPDERTFYQEGKLRRRELLDQNDGRIRTRVDYNQAGIVEKREEYGRFETPVMTWLYNAAGEPVAALQNPDGDGHINTWYHYKNNRIIAIEDDSNQDGKKDVWETYDDHERLVLRKKDIDFDGIPDVEETK